MKVVLRRTEVIDDKAVLPRPKITQDVLFVGSMEECKEVLEKEAMNPKNQSTDQIEVNVYISNWQNQKNYTSKSITKDNGKRNPYN